jgi:2-iminobutanoate/2-iminopropanoate deaminase
VADARPRDGAREVSRPIGPYSPVLRAGEWVVTSGQLGAVPADDGSLVLVDGGTTDQLRQALANLAEVLGREGATLEQVVKATVFLVDMADFASMNEVWTEVFGDHRPTRSAVGVAALPLGARVEVEAWAHAPAG